MGMGMGHMPAPQAPTAYGMPAYPPQGYPQQPTMPGPQQPTQQVRTSRRRSEPLGDSRLLICVTVSLLADLCD